MWTFSSSFLCATNCSGGEFEAASTTAVAAWKAFQTMMLFPMAGSAAERFCSRTSRTGRPSEFIYKISSYSIVLTKFTFTHNYKSWQKNISWICEHNSIQESGFYRSFKFLYIIVHINRSLKALEKKYSFVLYE